MAPFPPNRPTGARPAGDRAEVPAQDPTLQISSRAQSVLSVLRERGPLRTGDIADEVGVLAQRS